MKINLKLRKIKITIVERHQLREGCTILFFIYLQIFAAIFAEVLKVDLIFAADF